MSKIPDTLLTWQENLRLRAAVEAARRFLAAMTTCQLSVTRMMKEEWEKNNQALEAWDKRMAE